LNMILLNIKMP